MPRSDLPARAFRDRSSWEAWLERNHATSAGIWVRIAKNSSGRKSVTYDEALEVALCYGWIDGQMKSEDEVFYRQRFVPRGKRSTWSKRNRDLATKLIRHRAMRPAGLAEIERAKRDGRWAAAYDSPSKASVPPDLVRALSRNAKATAFFSTLDSRNRYAILYRLQTAKKPETRARRLERFVRMLEAGEKIYP